MIIKTSKGYLNLNHIASAMVVSDDCLSIYMVGDAADEFTMKLWGREMKIVRDYLDSIAFLDTTKEPR